MKIKFTLVIALLIGIAVTYTACKKSSSQPATKSLTAEQVSSKVALNIGSTLRGGFGSFDMKDGLGSLTILGLKTKGNLKTGSVNDAVCGSTRVTPVVDSAILQGIKTTVKGVIVTTQECNGGVFSGFQLTDDMLVSQSAPDNSSSVQLDEKVLLLASDPTEVNSNFSFQGTINYIGNYNSATGTNKGPGSATFNYLYQSTAVDPNQTYPIISGTATFYTKGTGNQGTWEYHGSVTFLGNNKVKVTISGADYIADMTTGVVSK